MFFGEVPVHEGSGHILGHSISAGRTKFRKGRTLSPEDINSLKQANIDFITIARLDNDDIGENAAAETISASLTSPTIRKSEAFTGRVNLFAAEDGLVIVDRTMINRLNAINEAMTVATLAQDTVVQKGQMIATIKIIPFGVAAVLVDQWVELAARSSALSVMAFRHMTAGMVLSGTDQLKPSVVRKTIDATRERLAVSGSKLIEPLNCRHDVKAVATAIGELINADCDMILASGVSAIVDRGDVIPSAIVAAGGEIVHFGMPVDPGNLILLGQIGDVPVIGLPGCARSPKLNGFDLILNRCAADVHISAKDIMEMGVGGLLKEGARPMPRETGGLSMSPERLKISALILAAGQSRRMGNENKLLKHFDGQPLIHRTVSEVIRSSVTGTTVVIGHQSDQVLKALEGLEIATAYSPGYASGLSASLKTGLQAISPNCDGLLICLGDMPFLSSRHIDKLIAAFDPTEGREICLPTFKGKRGNPVLWSRRFINEMKNIRGDTGARHLIGDNADVVTEVEMDDDGILIDLDSPEAWDSAQIRLSDR